MTSDLYGLVLAGGKSARMGRDKGLLDYHGRPQREWLADLLAIYCSRVFVSVRSGQVESEFDGDDFTFLEDLPEFGNHGPIGALLTAQAAHPNHAWLVVSCDLPFFDQTAIACLLRHRAPGSPATAFINHEIDRPEPLSTIYEPGFMNALPAAFAAGANSMMRILHTLPDVSRVIEYDPLWIMSADTPEAFDAALQRLRD